MRLGVVLAACAAGQQQREKPPALRERVSLKGLYYCGALFKRSGFGRGAFSF